MVVDGAVELEAAITVDETVVDSVLVEIVVVVVEVLVEVLVSVVLINDEVVLEEHKST